jgi:hypothetical protein
MRSSWCVAGAQGYKVNSPDGTVLLMPQPDGNLVLYNTAKYVASGAVPSAAVWASGTGGAYGAPFRLVMQQVGVCMQGDHLPQQLR